MSLVLSNYSAKLLKRRQKRQISSMLQRGSSRQAILFLLAFQMAETTLSAVIVSYVIGYPFTWMMLKSNNFLNFSGESVYPVINMSVFYTITLSAFVLATVTNTRDIWLMSNISLVKAHTEVQRKKPFWEKFFLDILLIIVGLVLWGIIKLQS